MHQHTENIHLMLMALAISIITLTVQTVFAVITGSLALWSDTAHIGADLAALVVILTSQRLAERTDHGQIGFQQDHYHRCELIGTIINGVLLLTLGAVLIRELNFRFSNPEPISKVIIIPGLLGLAGNLLALQLLRSNRRHLSIRGAFYHLLSDSLSSCGVILAGVLIWLSGEKMIDPIISAFIIGLIIIYGLRLLIQAGKISRKQHQERSRLQSVSG